MVFTHKKTHYYIQNHYQEWFPQLPGYPCWNKRLRLICEAFPTLIEYIVERLHNRETPFTGYHLLDSLPIKLARGSRSSWAKVAAGLANKGYCDCQDEWYYGVKLHIQAAARFAQIPVPQLADITTASTHDLTAWRSHLLIQENQTIYADKAYKDNELKRELETINRVILNTPHKKAKGQPNLLLFQQVDNTNFSRIRQPIDALFAWLQEKTGIQNASKVRSISGLYLHIWGKLAACMIIMVLFNC